MNVLSFFMNAKADRQEIAKKHQERLISSYKEVNNGIEPNVDAKGRLHAPVDGYVIPEKMSQVFDFSGTEDRIWGKGEFLPVPLTDLEMEEEKQKNYGGGNYGYRVKILTTPKEAKEFVQSEIAELHCKECKIGNEFEKYDQTMCYLYFKTDLFYSQRAEKANGENIVRLNNILFEKRRESAKLKGKVPSEGKQELTGKVIKVSFFQDGDYISRRCIVELENKSTIMGTLPGCLPDDFNGKIQFKATVKHSKNDETHGYFSRPHAVEIMVE